VGESRQPEQLRRHFEVERDLATQLQQAPKHVRSRLYAEVYDRLYRFVPDHPQLTRKQNSAMKTKSVSVQMALLQRFLTPETVFLELGPGDCSLSFAVAEKVRRVVAVDVSAEITAADVYPVNFQLILSDGCNSGLPSNSITVAYSNQLMEHLHPEDVIDQLRDIFRVLAPDGLYVCITPNRLSGPHDISRHFSETAVGLHLKEYTAAEVTSLFRATGFSEVYALVGARGRYLTFPVSVMCVFESLIGMLPRAVLRKVTAWRTVRSLLGLRLLARKAAEVGT
jgi:SAM-dependent methyltransferase